MTLAQQRGESRLAPFTSIEEPLTTLLREFGLQRQSYHPEFPFWRLQNDGDFWDVPERDTVQSALGDRQGGDVPKSILRDHGVSGGFSTDVDAISDNIPELVNQLAARLLEEHFPALTPTTFSTQWACPSWWSLGLGDGLEIQALITSYASTATAARSAVTTVASVMQSWA